MRNVTLLFKKWGGRNLICSFVLGLICLNAFAQRDTKIPINIAILDICEGRSHIYINIPKGTFKTNTSVKLKPRWSNQFQNMYSTAKGFEIELFNVPVSKRTGEISFNIEANNLGGVWLDNSISQNIPTSNLVDQYVYQRTENEILNVSNHLDAFISDYQKFSSNTPIYTYFCGKQISTVELLAFFQDFMKLTDIEICTLLNRYNYLSNMENVLQISYLENYQLCKMFEDFLRMGTGNNDDDCLCKEISTNRAAFFLENAGSGFNEDGCSDNPPRISCRNYEIQNDDDDLIVSYGRLGAAKAVTLALDYDGCDDSPDDFSYGLQPCGAAVAFRSVCLDPITLSSDLANCQACTKEIKLKYSYQSASEIYGFSGNNYGCTGESIEITGEDWASFIINNDLTSTIVETKARKHFVNCGVDGPSLGETITSSANLVDDITTFIGGTISPTAIAEVAVQIIDFLDENIFISPCNSLKVDNYNLIGGEYVYELKPGGFFQATIISGATLAGEAENVGEGWVTINSDFFLAATLKTKADENGEIPSYCSCEKIGAYVLGSLADETPASNCFFSDGDPIINLANIYNEYSRSNQVLQNIVGVYLGLEGPWDPKWSNAGGCCSAVDINCLAECAYIVEPCSGVSPRINSTNYADAIKNLSIIPNPFSEGFTLVSFGGTKLKKAMLYDLNGKILMISEGIADSYKFDTTDFTPGLYILKAWDENNFEFTKKVLKQ